MNVVKVLRPMTALAIAGAVTLTLTGCASQGPEAARAIEAAVRGKQCVDNVQSDVNEDSDTVHVTIDMQNSCGWYEGADVTAAVYDTLEIYDDSTLSISVVLQSTRDTYTIYQGPDNDD